MGKDSRKRKRKNRLKLITTLLAALKVVCDILVAIKTLFS